MVKRASLIALVTTLTILSAAPPAAPEYAQAPVGYPGDYNGDGIWDRAIVYQQSNSLVWYIRLGSYWGAPTIPQAGLAPARAQHLSRRARKLG